MTVLPGSRFFGCLIVLTVIGCVAAAQDVADTSSASPEYQLDAYAMRWWWDEGVHYGVDVPDPEKIWEDGGLHWRPLLRGYVGLRFSLEAAGVRRHGDFIELEDVVAARRAYFYTDGSVEKLWRPLTFKFEIGAVNDHFSLRNASVTVHEIPYVGTFTAGTFDAPMSLAFLTSSRATPLMESGMVIDALAPGTQSGAMLANWLPPQRVTWAFGLLSLGGNADTGDSSKTPVRFVGRTTWLPWRIRERHFLHLGLNVSWAFSPSADIHFQSRPESFLAPFLVDTGKIDARQTVVAGPEILWLRDRLSVQGEALPAVVFRDGASNPVFNGFYGMVSYFLTPDARAYDERSATFTSLTPSRPLSWRARQLGAFEVALRWSRLDLTDAGVRGGLANTLMSGLNWYWNRYVRMQFNVGYAHASDGPRPGDYVILQTRFDLML